MKPFDNRRLRARTIAGAGASAAFTATLLAIACFSCGRDRRATTPRSYQVVRHYESGPLAVDLMIDREKITVAERLTVRVVTVAPEAYALATPGPESQWGDFALIGFETPEEKRFDQGRVVREETYLLEPFLAGRYAVPSLTIVATPARRERGETREPGEGPLGAVEIATDEIPVEVASVLPAGVASPGLKDIAGPVELTPARWGWLWLAVAIGGAIFALVVGWRRRRRAHTPPAAPPPPSIPPHEIAWGELERLLAEGLIATGAIGEFYARLTGILRRYIEARFGFHAPVQTTEEFLVAIAADASFEGAYGTLLRRFLEHCDLVKFAGERPGGDAIERTIETSKRFINETKAAPAGAKTDAIDNAADAPDAARSRSEKDKETT